MNLCSYISTTLRPEVAVASATCHGLLNLSDASGLWTHVVVTQPVKRDTRPCRDKASRT
jgi:hypothetical protein